ncbi:MAG: thioredoxin family protein [Candidatus Sumerlaeaceae bacterium]|nr:thioredoxin family protein [Candidatus Sumerlaeaceae bacterium]
MLNGCRAVALYIILLSLTTANALADGWHTDYSSAAAAARESGRPLLLIFEQEGCPDCERLEAVLRRKSCEADLRNAVKVKLDYSSYPRLADQFGVSATPTIVLLHYKNGAFRTVYRSVGSLQAGAIASLGRRIDNLANQPEQPRRTETASPSQRPGGDRPSAVAQPAVVSQASTEPQTIVARHSARVPGVRGNYFFYRPGGVPYDQQ